MINRTQNKSLCLYNMCVRCVYLLCTYIKTQTYSIYFDNTYMYIYINIIYII